MQLGAGFTTPNACLAMAVGYALTPHYDAARDHANTLVASMGGSEWRPDSERVAMAHSTPLKDTRITAILGHFFLDPATALVLLWSKVPGPEWTHAFVMCAGGETYSLFDTATGKLYAALDDNHLTAMLEQRGGAYRAYTPHPQGVAVVAAATPLVDEEEVTTVAAAPVVKKPAPVRKRAASTAVAPAPQPEPKRADVEVAEPVAVEK